MNNITLRILGFKKNCKYILLLFSLVEELIEGVNMVAFLSFFVGKWTVGFASCDIITNKEHSYLTIIYSLRFTLEMPFNLISQLSCLCCISLYSQIKTFK